MKTESAGELSSGSSLSKAVGFKLSQLKIMVKECNIQTSNLTRRCLQSKSRSTKSKRKTTKKKKVVYPSRGELRERNVARVARLLVISGASSATLSDGFMND